MVPANSVKPLTTTFLNQRSIHEKSDFQIYSGRCGNGNTGGDSCMAAAKRQRADTMTPSFATNTPPALVAPDNQLTPVTPPPNIFPTSPLAQVVRLTQAGVDPSVIMTYITNSSSTFNLDSDKIIYASDAGVPSAMVTAMMQRDQFLATTVRPPPKPRNRRSKGNHPNPKKPLRLPNRPRRTRLTLRPNRIRNRSRSIIFTIRSRPMAVGWWSTVMAGAGGQPFAFIIQAGSRIAIAGAGSIPTAAGIGIRITRGARRSTMGAGFTTRATAGAGIPTPSGRPRG